MINYTLIDIEQNEKVLRKFRDARLAYRFQSAMADMYAVEIEIWAEDRTQTQPDFDRFEYFRALMEERFQVFIDADDPGETMELPEELW